LPTISLQPLLNTIPGRRTSVAISAEARAFFNDAVVLLTGAGGSIGGALARQLLDFSPRRLILLDKSEHNLYRINLRLQARKPTLQVVTVLGDVGNAQLLDDLFLRQRPELVLHAAAYKHVPLLEGQPETAVRNNTLGTYALARRALAAGSRKLVMLSTDKAVNPASIMGVSKRLAELVLLGLNTAATPMTSVRFGNVLGSRGSVVPLFRSQLRRGKSLTVTHPRAERYFLTNGEAVRTVIEGTWLGIGGDILVPELGQPVRISEVAAYLMQRQGRTVPVVYTGLRPGEKLSEELFYAGEAPVTTAASGILRLLPLAPSADELEEWIAQLDYLTAHRDTPALLEMLARLVPEYRPSAAVIAQGEQLEPVETDALCNSREE
jgi:FlaA1/EpsC-like NDP-sugar epimerase